MAQDWLSRTEGKCCCAGVFSECEREALLEGTDVQSTVPDAVDSPTEVQSAASDNPEGGYASDVEDESATAEPGPEQHVSRRISQEGLPQEETPTRDEPSLAAKIKQQISQATDSSGKSGWTFTAEELAAGTGEGPFAGEGLAESVGGTRGSAGTAAAAPSLLAEVAVSTYSVTAHEQEAAALLAEDIDIAAALWGPSTSDGLAIPSIAKPAETAGATFETAQTGSSSEAGIGMSLAKVTPAQTADARKLEPPTGTSGMPLAPPSSPAKDSSPRREIAKAQDVAATFGNGQARKGHMPIEAFQNVPRSPSFDVQTPERQPPQDVFRFRAGSAPLDLADSGRRGSRRASPYDPDPGVREFFRDVMLTQPRAPMHKVSSSFAICQC